ncbi:MAG TPA: SdpI family protein [Armatimonadota bacterium]|jgi:hypothetical protein|nr:SdpI family protein [Candidatus Brocadiia bacterium]HJN18440.1 SdpI family protein [Armatimonadota bacterium]
MQEHFWEFPSVMAVPLGSLGLAAVFALAGAALVWAPPKPNAWAGVRTPWTYADEAIWHESHRVFGWGALASGALCLVYCPVAIVVIVIAGVGSLPYSWVRYAAKYGTSRTWKAEEGWRGYRPMAKCSGCDHQTKLGSPDELADRRCEQCGETLLHGH